MDFVERYELDPSRLGSPQDVRGLLAEAITFTEFEFDRNGTFVKEFGKESYG